MDGGYLVTGASSGIGRAVAEMIVSRGGKVLAVARGAEGLDAFARGREGVFTASIDLERDEAPEETAEAVKRTVGTLKGFVHCAGFVETAPLGLVRPESARRMYAVHALFPMRFLGWMAKKSNHAPGASAVLALSTVTRECDLGNAAYASAKGAAEGMLKTAAGELLERGIRLNAVVFGVVDTPMARRTWMDRSTPERVQAVASRYPLGFGTPEKAAETIGFFLDDASSWIAGQCLVADGGRSLT